MTAITGRPSVVIGPRSERPLDGADAPSLNGMLPGGSTLQQASQGYVKLHVGDAVWAVYGPRWRQGWVVGPTATTQGGGTRALTVEVEYVANRLGTVYVHRFEVSKLRLRDVAGAKAQDVAS